MGRTLPIPSPESSRESAETRESRAFRRRLPAFYVSAKGAPADTWPSRVACSRGNGIAAPIAPIPAPQYDAHVRLHAAVLAARESAVQDAQTLRTIDAAIDASHGGPVVSEGLQWPLPRATAIEGRDAIAARRERSAYLGGAAIAAWSATDDGREDGRPGVWRAALPVLVSTDRPDAPSRHAARDWAPLASDYRAWHAEHGADHAACLAAGIDPAEAGIPAPPSPDPCAYVSERSPRGIHCPASLGTSDASKRAARGESVSWPADETAYRATHRAALMDAVRAAPSNRAARDPYHALRAACLRDGVPVPPLQSLRD